MMRQPYIVRSLLFDLYFAPERVENLEPAGALKLKKGENRQVGDLTLTFAGFDLEGHEQVEVESLRVFAEITVEHDGETATIRPAVVHSEDLFGQPSVVKEPAELVIAGQVYEVSIDRILADEKAVVIEIPELLPKSPPDRLIMDISKKPMINLVWAGTTLILLGSVIVFIRRRGEMARR